METKYDKARHIARRGQIEAILPNGIAISDEQLADIKQAVQACCRQVDAILGTPNQETSGILAVVFANNTLVGGNSCSTYLQVASIPEDVVGRQVQFIAIDDLEERPGKAFCETEHPVTAQVTGCQVTRKEDMHEIRLAINPNSPVNDTKTAEYLHLGSIRRVDNELRVSDSSSWLVGVLVSRPGEKPFSSCLHIKEGSLEFLPV